MTVRRTRMPNIAFPAAALAYAEITSPVTVTSELSATPDTIVTAGAISVDGSTRIKVTFFTSAVDLVAAAAGNVLMSITLNDGATELGRLAAPRAKAVASEDEFRFPVLAQRIFTPTNGSHTYSICAFVLDNAIGSTVFAGAGGDGDTDLPAFLLIERCP